MSVKPFLDLTCDGADDEWGLIIWLGTKSERKAKSLRAKTIKLLKQMDKKKGKRK